MGIFVENVIWTSMDSLWAHTQDPGTHQRWDLRFTAIEYLPRLSATEPQRFRYATRIGFGIAVEGEGETVAERNLPDGSRTSSLRFGSDDRLSLIREGTGYWRYTPAHDGVRFTTWYDYRTRHGPLGAFVDRLVFRPMLGWATAWSFDRLRLWLENDVAPASSARAASIHAIARLGLAAVFAYHGLVPKLLTRDPAEVAMLRNAGVSEAILDRAMLGMGLLELAIAVALIGFWHRRWLAVASLAFAATASIGVALTSPESLRVAFNPAIVNGAVAALALIDLLALPETPDAGRCCRRPGETDR